MAITWHVDEREFEIIGEIADRAVQMARDAGEHYSLQDARMDITACHANGNPLQLAALRDADEFNFAHDVFGIRRHLNRETGTLENCFLPRFAIAHARALAE